MSQLTAWLGTLPVPVVAAVVAAAVALTTSIVTAIIAPLEQYSLGWRMEARKLDLQYRAEQQKALRDRLARYKGLLLRSAEALNKRLWEVHESNHAGWLYGNHGHGLQSTAYRVLAVLAVARLVERESLYVDATVASPSDFEFVRAIGLSIRVWTAGELFSDVRGFDPSIARDYLFGGIVRRMTDHLSKPDGTIISQEEFAEATGHERHEYQPLVQFLSGLWSVEGRLRADRLLSVHLILLATLNAFGYRYQHAERKRIATVAGKCEHKLVLRNLARMVEELRLDDNREFRVLVRVIRPVGAENDPCLPASPKAAPRHGRLWVRLPWSDARLTDLVRLTPS